MYYLKENDHLYEDIIVKPENISRDLITLVDTHNNNLDNQSDNEDETLNLTDILVNQLDIPTLIIIEEVFKQSQMENECINIAPGEGRQPKSILNDEFCGELSFPHLFPTGKIGYKDKRNINLRPVKYFNQILWHFSQKFASDTDYIFFARSVLQNLSMQEQLNVAVLKISTPALKAGFFNNTNFMEAIREYVENDQTFTFKNSIKGTPAY